MIRLPVEGEAFGRYRLLRTLGHGGMGVVYAAHDETLRREVALKLVTPHLAADAGFRARFQHEAEVLARVESPRIVRIYDHGEQDGVLFLVTQLIAGGDLNKLVQREGTLPPALASSVVIQVVEALADAHAAGVVHRDIKPANVLLRERGRELEAFLCDFGIATTVGADLSRTGTIAGSLPYMAPERHRGEDAGPQGDIYSAGCLLWHTLTGAAPYAGTDVEVAFAHIQAPVPELPGKDAFSVKANAIIAKAMAKDRRKRYPTARAMLSDLTQLAALAPDAISLPGATQIRRPIVVPRRRWAPALVAVAATLAVLGTTAVAVGALRDEPAGEPAVAAEQPTTTTSGPVVQDTPTLTLARRGADPAPLPGLPDDVPEEVAEALAEEWGEAVGDAPAADEEGGDRPGSTSQAPGTVGPAPTTAAPSPSPVYRYQCWDRRKVEASSSCTTMPAANATGASWIFRKMNTADLTCTAYDRNDTTQDVASWNCGWAGKPAAIQLSITRWTSRAEAKKFFVWFSNDTSPSDWLWGGTERIGEQYVGKFGERYRFARLYDIAPWSIQWATDTTAQRESVFPKVNGYRHPTRFRFQEL